MRLHRGGEPDGYRRQRRALGGRRTAVRAPRGRLLLWCAQARRHPLSRRMESSMTLSLDLLLSLCTALAIGLLIGAERGWQERDHEDARQIAGIRTFSLAGLLGGFATLLAGELGSAVWVALLLALAALAVAGYVSDVRRGGDQGMTTEIALLMTFLLGSLALTEQRLLAAAGGIVLTLLLSLKDKLHALLKRLTAEELSGTLKLLFISVVLLPVLPNQGYGPWAFFNPYLTWWMVVLIAALGFSAYLAIRLIGSRKGLLLTAVLGGLLATSALMFPRILVEIGAIHPALLKELALPFAATTLVYLGGTLFHALRGGRASQEAPDEPGLRNPFELLPALRFAAVLSAILLLVEVGRRLFGDAGIYAVALLSGLADVDAITLSLARAAQGELDPGVASRGIALAALSNSLVKAGLVVLVGGKRLALQTLPFSLAGLLVGALLILL
ncbi:MgtC/SapB family protein [Pseudomonas aeruginosa]|uniref:MgtC/SapB family protein n=1 Tax=Pseudomonas aeruginosa TaxID=287 RepID=UPI0038923C2A